MPSELDEEIRRIHLKHIEKISKHLQDEFLGTTQEERNEERRDYITRFLGESAQTAKLEPDSPMTKDQFEQVLIDKYHFKATKDAEELYYYDGQKYVKGGEWLINQLDFSFQKTPLFYAQIWQFNHIIDTGSEVKTLKTLECSGLEF